MAGVRDEANLHFVLSTLVQVLAKQPGLEEIVGKGSASYDSISYVVGTYANTATHQQRKIHTRSLFHGQSS